MRSTTQLKEYDGGCTLSTDRSSMHACYNALHIAFYSRACCFLLLGPREILPCSQPCQLNKDWAERTDCSCCIEGLPDADEPSSDAGTGMFDFSAGWCCESLLRPPVLSPLGKIPSKAISESCGGCKPLFGDKLLAVATACSSCKLLLPPLTEGIAGLPVFFFLFFFTTLPDRHFFLRSTHCACIALCSALSVDSSAHTRGGERGGNANHCFVVNVLAPHICFFLSAFPSPVFPLSVSPSSALHAF